MFQVWWWYWIKNVSPFFVVGYLCMVILHLCFISTLTWLLETTPISLVKNDAVLLERFSTSISNKYETHWVIGVMWLNLCFGFKSVKWLSPQTLNLSDMFYSIALFLIHVQIHVSTKNKNWQSHTLSFLETSQHQVSSRFQKEVHKSDEENITNICLLWALESVK